MDVKGATGVLRAGPEGLTAESDPGPMVQSEEMPKSSSATGASDRSTHANNLSEDRPTQCSTPKEATPHLGNPKEATGAPNLPDTFRMDNSPSTEAASIKATTHELSNQEKNGTTSPPKGKLAESKAADGVKKDGKAAGVPTGARKNIPPKKDRMDPLKLDMTKPTVIPLTSSQLSLQCLECHIIFSDDKSMRRHLKMSHPAEYEQCMLGDSLFACYVCDRHFANSTDLMAHQRTHTEKQPFKCVICGEAFKRSSELTTHKKMLHYSSQGYKCSDCGKACKTLTLLKYHSRTHTGEKPYVCKECGKRFSMPKALQRHIESHSQEEGEENGDGTNAAAKPKKQKNNGSSERKYSCPHCKAMFKTEKTKLHHIKVKHSQNKSVPPSQVTQHSISQGPPPPFLTQATIGQPPVLRLDSGGQAPQCIEPEQIKRLIESLGNVQKVNQLVIYGLEPVSFQSQTVNLQPVPGVVQPIRFDMTQATPSVESTGPGLNGGQGVTNDHSSVEKTVQDHTGAVNSEFSQPQVECADKAAEMACSAVKTKAVETGQDDAQIQMLEWQQSSSLIPTNELENESSHIVSLQEEVVHMQYMTPTDTLSLVTSDSLHQTEDQVVTLTPIETQIVTLTSMDKTESSKTNAGKVGAQDVCQTHLKSSDEPKDFVEQTETNTNKFCSEVHFSEEISIQTQPSFHDSERVETHTEPFLYESDSATVVTTEKQPGSGETAKLPAPVKLKKGRPAKKTSQKAKSKTDITSTQQTGHNGTVLTSQQIVLAPNPPSELKTTVTQQSRAKSHILVQFGNRTKKEKLSLAMQPSKRSKKVKDDVKQQDKGDIQQKKMGGDGKVKTSKSGNKIQKEMLSKLQNNELQVVQKDESKSIVRSRKRKFKIHKITNSTLIEKEVITAPLPKKKRQEKTKNPKSQKTHKRTSKKEVIKRTLKVKQKEKEEAPVAVVTNLVKEDALLLLKGHKQPQLKVHKLDAPKTLSQIEPVPSCPSSTTSNEVTEMAPMKQTEDHKNKLTKAKTAKMPTQTCVETPSSAVVKATPIHKKTKAGRKRKTTKAHGKMTSASPPLICDCGLKFFEVSALQEHMATAHTSELHGHHGCSSGTPSEVQEQSSNNSVGSKTHELQVTTDWDAEVEMGEIGLGDREDQRVSFPALNPSPSLTHAPSSVDSECDEPQKKGSSTTTERGLPLVTSASTRSEQPQAIMVCQQSTPVSQTPSQMLSADLSKPEQGAITKVRKKSAFSQLPRKHQKGTSDKGLLEASQKISDTQDVAHDIKSTGESDNIVEEDMKDDLPLDVNLVTVQEEDQLVTSQDDDFPESPEKDGQIASKIQEMPSHHNGPNLRESNSESSSQTKHSEPVVDSNTTSVVKDSSTDPPEIKQEDVEMAVHSEKTSGQNRSNTTRGRKRGGGGGGGGGRGRGRRGTGKRRNMGSRPAANQASLNDDPDECRIVYQLYPVSADSEERSAEGKGPQVCTNPPEMVESQEDSSEEQVVFELESVTTSVDVVKSEMELDSQDRSQGSSPGILLEKFLTSRELGSNESTCIPNKVVSDSTNVHNNEGSTDHRTTRLPSLGTSGGLNVKEEDQSQPVMPPVLTPEVPDARVQGVNRSLSTEQQQSVHMFVVKEEDPLVLNEPQIIQQPNSNDKRRNGDLSTSTAAVADPPMENNLVGKEIETGASSSQQPSAKQCIFFPVKEEERELLLDPSQRVENHSTSALEECDDICEISAQRETQCVDDALEDDDMGGEQHNTEELLKFLLQSSDTEDSGCIDSEPEAETLAMSCYHGSRGSRSANLPVKSSQEAIHSNDNQRSQTGVRSQDGQRNPIDYFNQYLDLKTWQDVANITAKTSKMSNPVTAKEVSQFVGIHIAMGTLQFPSTKLYWEDYTRVALIADAMPASRFSELLSKLKIAEESGSSVSQRKDTGPPTNSVTHHSEQMCTTQGPLKTNPLNKVHSLVEKVQKTCQALKQEGNHGINQYPLWLRRTKASPAYSLHHTVMLSTCGLVVDFNLSLDDSDREETVKNMVLSGQNSKEGIVFLCKPELSTPSMLEQLLEAGVQSAGKVGGARGQVGDEFVSSDGKLKLFRCHHGFILSAAVKGRSRSTSLVSGFERALRAAKLNRDLRNAYRTPCLSLSPTAWPLSVLWHLTDLALVNSWLQYRGDCSREQQSLSLMGFRLEVSKALIFSSSADAQDATPPHPPAPERTEQATVPGSPSIFETPLPDSAIRYDGVGHWPEQVAEGEGARCRFGGCERTSRVRCLKCCVFLCISRNHNCFLKFHSQGTQ